MPIFRTPRARRKLLPSIAQITQRFPISGNGNPKHDWSVNRTIDISRFLDRWTNHQVAANLSHVEVERAGAQSNCNSPMTGNPMGSSAGELKPSGLKPRPLRSDMTSIY